MLICTGHKVKNILLLEQSIAAAATISPPRSKTPVTHPPDEVEVELQQPDERARHPHVEDGDDGEHGGPDQGTGDGHQGGEQAVEPKLGAGEDEEGHPVDHLEALGVVGLGKDVVETKL